MYSSAPIYKKLADVSGASGATNNFYFRPEGFENVGIQYILNSGVGVLKIYGSMNSDVESTSHLWEDITNSIFSVSSLSASTTLADNNSSFCPFALVKLEVVSSGAYDYNILLKLA